MLKLNGSSEVDLVATHSKVINLHWSYSVDIPRFQGQSIPGDRRDLVPALLTVLD